MLRSSGTGFNVVQRYDANMPGWQMRPGDRHMVGDFSGEGREDLWVFNGSNWSIPYLGMLRSNGTSLSMARRYDNKLPGWQMRANDRHYVGDFDGDGKADLYVFNGDDWSIAYLGMFRSLGYGLCLVERYDGNVPGWQMRRHDRHWLADINGDGGAICSSTTIRTGPRNISARWCRMAPGYRPLGEPTGSASGTSARWIASKSATTKALRGSATSSFTTRIGSG